jgi:hypothetical protein
LRGGKEGRGRGLREEEVGRVLGIGKRRERVGVDSEQIQRYDSEGDEEEMGREGEKKGMEKELEERKR